MSLTDTEIRFKPFNGSLAMTPGNHLIIQLFTFVCLFVFCCSSIGGSLTRDCVICYRCFDLHLIGLNSTWLVLTCLDLTWLMDYSHLFHHRLFLCPDSICYHQRKNMESTLHGTRCQSSRSSRGRSPDPMLPEPFSLPLSLPLSPTPFPDPLILIFSSFT